MALTDMVLRNAKPQEKPYKLFEGGGLHLLVNPNGSRIWRLAYRFAGKPKQLSFGPYPTVSLADARQKREDVKKLLLDGQDPSTVRKLDKVRAEVAKGAASGWWTGNIPRGSKPETQPPQPLPKTDGCLKC